MTPRSGSTVSLWHATAELARGDDLREDLTVDACVVGAGIAGVTTAYLLRREGLSVAILEDGAAGSGETGRTTAHLASALDDRFCHLERLHGEGGARLAAESHRAAIDRIEAIVREEGIDCDFERLDGWLFASRDQGSELLDRELEAARRAGMSVERGERLPLRGLGHAPCLRFADQGQFHPLRYLGGLVESFRRSGGRLFTGAHAEEIEGGSPARVRTSSGREVRARSVVVATNTPVSTRFAIHTKQAPYRTYVVTRAVPPGAVPRALYWDTADPYHYVRLQPGAGPGGADVLIVGGEDHKTGQEEDPAGRFDGLEAWVDENLPQAGERLMRWSGQVMEPVDGIAFIGRDPTGDDGLYLATGDSGQGMTHGTIAGMLLTDLVVGRENPWATLYDPGRITLRAASEFARENLNVAAQYRDWVTPGEVESADEIPRGKGAILRRGAGKVAVHRDEAGVLHERSAVCTHLGCIVAWNDLERSWDCPCHGSRFDPYGKVLNGPAIRELGPAEPS
jgi:glycine/D-amino acid oxidase-like deaminating enzyme/nitrite reductase/ring-hydroxylating ferredoxin subunit